MMSHFQSPGSNRFNRREAIAISAVGTMMTTNLSIAAEPEEAKPGSHSLASKYQKVNFDTRGTDYDLPSFSSDDKPDLSDKRVLFISADGPELPELDVPMEYLKACGAKVKLAGQDWIFHFREPAGHIVIAEFLADEICVKADFSMIDVKNVGEYQALFIPGGAWNPDMLRTDGDALRIVREARAQNLLIVSLCHGPQVLINANHGLPKGQELFPHGTKITGVANIRVDLANAGFKVHEQEPTVYDEKCRLLTARDPKDLGPLCIEMGKRLRS